MDIQEVGEEAQLSTKDIQEEAWEALLFNGNIQVREEAPVSVKYILEEGQDQPYIRDIQDKLEEASLLIKNIQEEEEEEEEEDIQEH